MYVHSELGELSSTLGPVNFITHGSEAEVTLTVATKLEGAVGEVSLGEIVTAAHYLFFAKHILQDVKVW